VVQRLEHETVAAERDQDLGPLFLIGPT